MNNIKYNFIDLNNVSTTQFKKEIPNYMPFTEAYHLYQRSRIVGRTDDGWAHIIEVDNTYYHAQIESGQVYLTKVKLINDEHDTRTDNTSSLLR